MNEYQLLPTCCCPVSLQRGFGKQQLGCWQGAEDKNCVWQKWSAGSSTVIIQLILKWHFLALILISKIQYSIFNIQYSIFVIDWYIRIAAFSWVSCWVTCNLLQNQIHHIPTHKKNFRYRVSQKNKIKYRMSQIQNHIQCVPKNRIKVVPENKTF